MADITPRKSMAAGGGMPTHDDFGVGKMCPEPMKGEGPNGRTLSVEERSVRAPVHHTEGKMPSQANPDHGPHR